jgi:hypothetical protein
MILETIKNRLFYLVQVFVNKEKADKQWRKQIFRFKYYNNARTEVTNHIAFMSDFQLANNFEN